MKTSDKTAASGAAKDAAAESTKDAGRRKLSLKKRLLFTVVALAICSIPAALGFELLLRLVDPQPLLPRYVTDSGFGIRIHCPNISIHHTTPDYRISIHTNSLGFRADREFPFAKPDGVFRIVGLGDSFTFGYGVEAKDTYLARVEQLLREQGRNVEVINMGVSGAGSAEELILLNELGLKFDPDLVILGYCTNDIADNTRSLLYALDDDGKLVRRNKEYLPAVKTRDFLYSFAIYRYLAERSHLLYFARRNLSELIQKRMRKENQQTEKLDDAGEDRLTAALIDEIRRTCKRHGAGFCLVDIPTNRFSSTLPREALTEVPPEEIIDMRPLFESRPKSDVLYWTRSDGHWTPLGHEIAAEAIVKRIADTIPAPFSNP